MSSELSVKEFIFVEDVNFEEYDDADDMLTTAKKEPVHGFVHDLEGFFWVLVWLCLSRDAAPACRWRELLPDNKDPKQKELRTTFVKTLEASDDVLAVKRPYFYNDVMGNISTYCTRLRRLQRQLYKALHDAHKRHGFESLYDKILSAFAAAEAKVAQLPTTFMDKYYESEKAEEERRCRVSCVYLFSSLSRVPYSNKRIRPSELWIDCTDPPAHLDRVGRIPQWRAESDPLTRPLGGLHGSAREGEFASCTTSIYNADKVHRLLTEDQLL
jgi:hypothetical protein